MNITVEQIVRWVLSKAYGDGYRYITMDECGEVFLFKNKPFKKMCDWYDGGDDFESFSIYFWRSANQLVSWEDEEPLDIGKYLGIVDWANVPVDTKVLVSSDGKKWIKRYFKCYDNVNFEYHYVCFDNGLTSWSDNFENKTCNWRYCKLAEDE